MERQSDGYLVGKVFSFDGEAGIIITEKNYYHFDKKDFQDKDIKQGDLVEFVSNTFKIGDEKELIALYISKLSKEDENIK